MSLQVVAEGFGGPEVLSVVDVEPRAPGPGEVALDVRAAGVNPADVKAYQGLFGTDPSRLPLQLGYEAAGVVAALGPGSVGAFGPLAVGDEVIAFRVVGGYAERLTVPGSAVVRKPAGLGWAQAGGLMLAGATAVHCLTAVGVEPGETVLVHGGAGGVGLMAVQLGVERGARVVATAREDHHELLRELGAVPVGYGPGLLDRVRDLAPEGVAAAVDTVGTDEAVDVSLAVVAQRSRIATIAAFARGRGEGLSLLGGGPGADPGTAVRDAARRELVELVDAGRLQVLVAATFPLAEVARAHELVMGRHEPGKIVLLT